MKLFKSIDEKFLEIGFVKVAEWKDPTYARYQREVHGYTHTLYLGIKRTGLHLVQSYDENLMDSQGIGNTCVGLTMYEMKLCLKKMKQMGLKMRKKAII